MTTSTCTALVGLCSLSAASLCRCACHRFFVPPALPHAPMVHGPPEERVELTYLVQQYVRFFCCVGCSVLAVVSGCCVAMTNSGPSPKATNKHPPALPAPPIGYLHVMVRLAPRCGTCIIRPHTGTTIRRPPVQNSKRILVLVPARK